MKIIKMVRFSKVRKLFIVGLLIFLLTGCNDFGTLDTIYSGSTEFTEFDDWLMEEVGIKATPAHIIVKNTVTNYTDETVSYTELEKLFENDKINIDLWQEKLSNDKYVKDYDLIIVKTTDCSACEYQEEHYEKTILANYKNKNILIYWIKTENCLGGCD